MKKTPIPQSKAKPDTSQGFFVQGISAKTQSQSKQQTNVAASQANQNKLLQQNASTVSTASSSMQNSQIHKNNKPSNPQKGVPLKSLATKQNANQNLNKKPIQVQSEKIKIDNSPQKQQLLQKQSDETQKKQQAHVEEKKTEVVQQPVKEQAPKQQEEKKVEVEKHVPVPGKVTIKYNHYNNQFDILDGKLKFSDIDEQYCFSFVFKGNYQLVLKHATSKEVQKSSNKIFENLIDGQAYVVEVIEDEEESKKEISKPYYASQKEESQKQNNGRINNLTNELKGMSIEELKQKGDKYKELIEARDLEDILYK
ncbi:hypothetical protein TTHERM_00655280 (macronuclear) [Tetrahymena thermophila SB210]|uniref:Uncharacterized protein n=1 Tax=Tetrahymena thermophila (strain SB210) TaxID=312017 RepID=Q22H24_TETTS|nr:hypothetical protein TTHERM_00655280 [Tetrahymena thermophila SB210]EAR84500.2 hypothetical protein TTHERM_00655280 [Tetrahymena thermophila SB210]|eukprot:XP_001032163.2 hypothetical protein TTHERM_00655280 [Tetrahymena thermophila SB210]